MNLKELQALAGIKKPTETDGSNISYTAAEKRAYEKKHNIKPGTEEWFRLWFARPYLTGENPYNDK